eukprot:2095912-Amphidinium_carterae.1
MASKQHGVLALEPSEQVIFHKMDALPEPKPISSKDELSAALKMADEDQRNMKTQFVTSMWGNYKGR